MIDSVLIQASEILDDIQTDMNACAERGLRRAGEFIPAILQRNFDSFGQRGGNKPWDFVSPWGMSLRKVNTDRPDEPLLDTGFLRRSGVTQFSQRFISETTLAEYGMTHEYGLHGIHVRSHMWILTEDLPGVNQVFEAGFISE